MLELKQGTLYVLVEQRWSGFDMRIGILGGTFDPIHIGHLVLAEESLRRLELDQIWFIPTGEPWLKETVDITDGFHRLAMVK